MRDAGVDLSRLNAAERAVLGLLAQGHTAKTIAAITDRSVGSVNERLREARRKTGIGSSRELARLVAAQENRDELIGVAGEDASAAPTDPAEVPPSRRAWPWIGGIAMMMIAAAVLAMTLMNSANEVSPPQADKLRTEMAAEPRDPVWADAAEHRLDDIYAPIAGVGPMTVRCRRTLCEVSGELSPGGDETAVATLQSSSVLARVRAAGFADSDLFGISTAQGGPVRFIAFWRATR